MATLRAAAADAQKLHQGLGAVMPGADSHAARIKDGGHIVGMDLVDIEADNTVATVRHRLTINGQPRHGAHTGQHTVQQRMFVCLHGLPADAFM